MASKTKLHFARFEFKYVLAKDLRDEVESELKYFLDFDPFVENRPHHQYLVRSLYFDDPYYTAFFDKIDGLHTRSKFRVRTYTDNPDDDTPYFLEIKGRHNNLVFKHRDIVKTVSGGIKEKGDDLAAFLLKHVPESPLRTQFEYEIHKKRIRPVALIDYFRRPYISKYDPEFRLTFDEQLQGTVTKSMFPSSTDRCRNLIPGYTVMEVKFRRHIPSWFHRIIQSYNLWRVSLSKICEGIETLELAVNLS